MRAVVAAVGLALLPAAAPAQTAARPAGDPTPAVAEAIERGGEQWLVWSVPTPAGTGSVCCFQRNGRERRCVLGGEVHGWGTSRDGWSRDVDEVAVYLETAGGRVHDLVLASPDCPVEGRGATIVDLSGVDAAASARFFAALARGDSEESIAERALAALAYHRGSEADRLLAELVVDDEAEIDLRRTALFWAGNLRGEAGVDLAEQILAGARNEDLLEGALFALAQSPVARAAERLATAARSAPSSDVRSHALFWLSQADGDRHAATLFDAAFADADDEVREHAVFALSQLADGATWLTRLLRESPDADVRRQALFWLAQSDDPRAMDELERVLAP